MLKHTVNNCLINGIIEVEHVSDLKYLTYAL